MRIQNGSTHIDIKINEIERKTCTSSDNRFSNQVTGLMTLHTDTGKIIHNSPTGWLDIVEGDTL